MFLKRGLHHITCCVIRFITTVGRLKQAKLSALGHSIYQTFHCFNVAQLQALSKLCIDNSKHTVHTRVAAVEVFNEIQFTKINNTHTCTHAQGKGKGKIFPLPKHHAIKAYMEIKLCTF